MLKIKECQEKIHQLYPLNMLVCKPTTILATIIKLTRQINYYDHDTTIRQNLKLSYPALIYGSFNPRVNFTYL